MIARKEWFERRKYGGWGVSPKSWQGWVYILFIIVPFVIFQSLPFWDVKLRVYLTICWLFLLFVDIIPIMITLSRDEREFKIEAISERNASWFMSLILIFGILFEVFKAIIMNQTVQLNVFILIALFGGAIVKSVSNFYFEKKKL